mmetsp:Transcript_2914/g.9546  ORF Transcript_2914/g.9546 Transcript_2914/m.9546 type:complete len:277 (-) Transcript_2914:146-976(-)
MVQLLRALLPRLPRHLVRVPLDDRLAPPQPLLRGGRARLLLRRRLRRGGGVRVRRRRRRQRRRRSRRLLILRVRVPSQRHPQRRRVRHHLALPIRPDAVRRVRGLWRRDAERPVGFLHARLKEQRHLHAVIFEVVVQVRAKVDPLVHREPPVQIPALRLERVQQRDDALVGQVRPHGDDVRQRHVHDLRRGEALRELVLEPHRHEIEQLPHAALAQAHDRRVRELGEDVLQAALRVHLLRPEQLVDERGVEHRAADVVQDLHRLVRFDGLRAKALL